MEAGIKNGRRGYISITNTESLYHATRIPSHKSYIEKADFSCCDGVAVVVAGKILGYQIPRLHGPDLMYKCCEFGVKQNWRHYFYGGKKGVPEFLRENLKRKFPGLLTVGTFSPPFRELTENEDKMIIKEINRSRPDILWVGLGLLKQETWIAQHLDKIDVPWMIGVGAAFDFLAGTVKRAPEFYRSLGLEWLYRVAFEPRMIKRNIYSSLIFIPVLREALSKNRFKKKERNNSVR
jgi:N-acetylglucosaminyldiphosphoundecaprenol N-acetyl-beta-D-mannosaminyltransferase